MSVGYGIYLRGFGLVAVALLLLAPLPVAALDLNDLRQRAEQGLPDAQTELGLVYERGRDGVIPNYTKARNWYEKAAKQGHTRAEYRLGEIHYYGNGVPRSYLESERWFRLAATKGHDWAQYYMGLLYAHGRGVTKDDLEAARWFSLAAKQGHEGAQSNFLAFKYDRKWRNTDGTLWQPDKKKK